MSKYDYDLFVIGAGSGGVRGSRIAAGFGARVGICEESLVGAPAGGTNTILNNDRPHLFTVLHL